jgi:dihydrofolate reductase
MLGTTRISIVVAMDRNGVIGKDGKVPWDLPGDRRNFYRLTRHKPIVMGRRTWESLPVPALPDRHNIVLSRDAHATIWRFGERILAANGGSGGWEESSGTTFTIFESWEEVLANAAHLRDDETIMVIGGAEVYALALPAAGRVYLTLVDGEYDGDTYFPGGVPGPPDWKVVIGPDAAKGYSRYCLARAGQEN